MNRLNAIENIRKKLSNNKVTIGSWIHLADSSVAEIMGNSGYDWVAVDQEHGSISFHQLPDIFRSLELGETLPLVRLSQGHPKDCKQALDAGAGGVIIPNVENSKKLELIIDACKWPPAGNRGVGFSRANLFGRNFKEYFDEAQKPLIVAMIESVEAIDNLDQILKVKGLDAILIGPYDLSASMNITGEFEKEIFLSAIDKIRSLAIENSVAYGIHIVEPAVENLKNRIEDGYQFIAYSIDSVFLSQVCENPIKS
jgi:2-dehydro-3-deoxyglucarate aldolase|tara:strand:- start:110 stop:874 length:765 start_codon:yes stop_codon:yes gene_type:complete